MNPCAASLLTAPQGLAKGLITLWALTAALLGAAHAAEGLAPVPAPAALVIDLTTTLTAEQREGLEARLRAFEDRKGSQLAVLIVKTARPEAIEQYALRVAEQWKLGRKKVDDGAILLVAKDDREVRIEVGYGLEGVLTDATSKRIISDLIVPRFKQGDYFGGVDSGVDQMIKFVDGEALPPAAQRPEPKADFGRLLPLLLLIAVGVGGALRATLGRLPGAALAAGGAGLIVWFLSGAVAIAMAGALMAFLVTLLGGGTGLHGGWYGRGGGHYRGGGFGGGGGGGFGGGGGGGFGGGGASGRW